MGVVNKLKLLGIFLIAPFAFYSQLIIAQPESVDVKVDELDSIIYKPGNDLSLDFSVAEIITRLHELISQEKGLPQKELQNFNQLHQSLISNESEVDPNVIPNGINELVNYLDANPGKYREVICESTIDSLRNFTNYLSDEEREEGLDPSIKRGCKLSNCNPCNNNTCRPKVKCLVCRGPRGPRGAQGPQGPAGATGSTGATGATGVCQICCPCPCPVQGAALGNSTTSGLAQNTTNGCCILPCCPTVSCCPVNGGSSQCCPLPCPTPCPPCPTPCPPCPTPCPPCPSQCVPLCSQFADGIINYIVDMGRINVMTQGCGFTVETLQVDPPTFLVRFLQAPFGSILVPLVSARIGNPKVTNITTSSFVIINDEPVDGLNFVVFPLCR